MTRIEGKKVTVQAPAAEVRTFLQNTDNLIHLLPSDRISDWKSDGASCSFKIQGAYTIGLELQAGSAPGTVVYRSSAGSPFPFTLTAFLQEDGPVTHGYQVCEAELNPFLVMIVKEPLRNLFNYMSERLAARYAGA